jgi:restriction endonuclease S subunit
LNFVLKHRKEFITIIDNQIYKRCRVQIQGKGVVLRDEILGKGIITKKQQVCKSEDFLVAEIDAKVGGYGIVPKELEGAIVSGHYFLFDIDKSKLLPEYLGILVKQEQFSRQVKSTGSTNYAAIRPYHVLDYQIPLPTLKEQEILINFYYSRINEAKQLEQQAENLESEIENYFLEQLGLTPFKLKEKNSSLQTIDYTFLDRWDFFSTDTRIAIELKNSKFELSSIGKSFHFAKRSFNKLQYKKDTFRYIEIGAIDPIKGILDAKEVETKNAPSRATQYVKEGDLIIGTTRPYLKKFAIVTSEYDNSICSSGFCVICQSPAYHLPYLHQFLKCSFGIEQLKNKMTGGLYPAITETELKEIKIPLPKLEIQKKIMTLIDLKKKNILKNKEKIVSIKIKAEKEFENLIFS